MKWLKRLLGAVIALALVLLVGGIMLSPKFNITRSTIVNAPADKIYPLVASPRQWKAWSAWNKRDPVMKIDYSGPESGTGAVWAWKSGSEGDGKMTFTGAEPGKRVGYELFFPDFGTTSTGEFRFEPDGSGTRVTWVMNGDMGKNPLNRWFALMMDGMVGKDFDEGLKNLKALAEKS